MVPSGLMRKKLYPSHNFSAYHVASVMDVQQSFASRLVIVEFEITVVAHTSKALLQVLALYFAQALRRLLRHTCQTPLRRHWTPAVTEILIGTRNFISTAQAKLVPSHSPLTTHVV